MTAAAQARQPDEGPSIDAPAPRAAARERMDFFPQKFSRAAGPSALLGAGGKIAAPAFDLPGAAAYKSAKFRFTRPAPVPGAPCQSQ